MVACYQLDSYSNIAFAWICLPSGWLPCIEISKSSGDIHCESVVFSLFDARHALACSWYSSPHSIICSDIRSRLADSGLCGICAGRVSVLEVVQETGSGENISYSSQVQYDRTRFKPIHCWFSRQTVERVISLVSMSKQLARAALLPVYASLRTWRAQGQRGILLRELHRLRYRHHPPLQRANPCLHS